MPHMNINKDTVDFSVHGGKGPCRCSVSFPYVVGLASCQVPSRSIRAYPGTLPRVSFPDFSGVWAFEELHLPSLLVGIAIGLVALPLLEFLLCLRAFRVLVLNRVAPGQRPFLCRLALISSPSKISRVMETLMAEDLSCSTPGIGSPQLTSARGWLEHRSRVGPFPSLVHTSWAIAGALDSLRGGFPEQARAPTQHRAPHGGSSLRRQRNLDTCAGTGTGVSGSGYNCRISTNIEICPLSS